MDCPSDSSHPSPAAPLRLCGFCRKPFLKESSYNRHILYCRRTRNRPRVRAKACRACNQAKVKCDLLQHQCSRCTKRGFQCIYDRATTDITAIEDTQVAHGGQIAINATQALTPVSFDNRSTPKPSNEYGSAVPHDDMPWDAHNFMADDIISQSPESTLLPNNPDDADLLNFFNSTFDIQQIPGADLPGSTRISPPNDDLTSCPGPVMATSLTERPGPDFLAPIPRSDPISSCTAVVIMQMLRAFPQMMLRRENLPPFIHGQWYRSASATEPAMPEPLISCMGIAQVFVSHNPETKQFIWRTIQREQRSAAEKTDQHHISSHDLLAAIQAQIIYLIMRVIDDSNFEPDLNLEMLVIYQSLCESFKLLCGQPFFQDERQYPSSGWEDWVFAESRRRTAIVWLLMTQMVHIKIGVPCDTFEGFRDIPLPAPKPLWEARTYSQWRSEYEVYKTMPRMGLDVLGDLIDASKQRETSANNKQRLDAWSATMDNLGMLVRLGVTMI